MRSIKIPHILLLKNDIIILSRDICKNYVKYKKMFRGKNEFDIEKHFEIRKLKNFFELTREKFRSERIP